MSRERLTEIAAELQSLAQAGLFYGKDKYDLERYEKIRDLAAEILSIRTDAPKEDIKELFCSDYGYQTPKVDTRAAIFRDGKILLVCESDGKWALPGGWCEYNMSAADNAVKEAKEEAGRDVRVKSVIAVQDRDKHNTPKYVFGIVKIFYLCEELGGAFAPNTETVAAEYFSEEELPELSPDKSNEEQIKMCFEAYRDKNRKTMFD